MPLTKQERRTIQRIVRIGNQTRYWSDPLAEKAALRDHIDACTENGMVAICRSGMDCDCTQYASTRIVPAPKSVIQFMREEDEHQQWLDGPESMWIDKPSNHDNQNRHVSSDRALEAYENGHPHLVTWTSL